MCDQSVETLLPDRKIESFVVRQNRPRRMGVIERPPRY
jgi:hypothetical protein